MLYWPHDNPNNHNGRLELPQPDADIDEFIDEHHDEVAAKLSAARNEIARDETTVLEPLEELLAEARISG